MINPAKIFGSPAILSMVVDASPIPRHNGNATKKTTKPEGRSTFQV